MSLVDRSKAKRKTYVIIDGEHISIDAYNKIKKDGIKAGRLLERNEYEVNELAMEYSEEFIKRQKEEAVKRLARIVKANNEDEEV
jgi:protein associated with RNAse G/E